MLSPTAGAPPPGCGATLTSTLILAQDVSCSNSTPVVYTIGARGVTIDLNGHTIHGGRVGISDTGFSGAVVKNGEIDSITGVKLKNVTNARIGTVVFAGGVTGVGVQSLNGTTNTYNRLSASDSLSLLSLTNEHGATVTGGSAQDMSRAFVDLAGTNDTFSANRAVDTGTAFSCDTCTNVTFTGNRDNGSYTSFSDEQPQTTDTFTNNVSGQTVNAFDLEDGAFTVQNNTIQQSFGDAGILMWNAYGYDDNGALLASTVSGNTVKSSYEGIVIGDSLGAVVNGNTTSGNSGDGLDYFNNDESTPSTLTNNVATKNAGLGIWLDNPVGNSSGNSARNNQQGDCHNVSCPGPVNNSLPTISATWIVGQKVTSTTGSWTMSNTGKAFHYQWLRCDADGLNCGPISGATQKSYTLTYDDYQSTIMLDLVGQDDIDSVEVQSAVSDPVGYSAPQYLVAPVITGTAAEGQLLTATRGTWTGPPSTSPATGFAYYWVRCDVDGLNCSGISGANTLKYLVTADDVGSTLEIEVDALDPIEVIPSFSSLTPVAQPSAPIVVAAPSILGTPNQGYTLNGKAGKWRGTAPISFSFQWSRCNPDCGTLVPISGATSVNYRATVDDVGYQLKLTVVAQNGLGQASATSAATNVIGRGVPPSNTGAPAIIGDLLDGATLHAYPGTWTGSPTITFTYAWYRCDTGNANCNAISGATHQNYTATAVDVGSNLIVTVSAQNGFGSPVQANGYTNLPIELSPPVNLTEPTLNQSSFTYGDVAIADPGTWSGLQPINFDFAWIVCDADGNNCSPEGSTGQGWGVPPISGYTIRVEVTATNADGQTVVDSEAYPLN